jgi:glycosidase
MLGVNTKHELIEYLTELSSEPIVNFFRPNFFVNTPDINPYYLQTSGRPGFVSDYGTMADVRRFIRAAHERGLRVIAELVVNHTSDQHPWFQRARHAPSGSAAREFYVWSETGKEYAGTRIIFLDTERSNWTWDPVANAYYWHRFYSHQPDLNFDNPRVLKEILAVMRFWFEMGIDGLRLDDATHVHGDRRGGSLPDHGHHAPDSRHSGELPMGYLSSQSRRADVRNGYGQ